MFEKDKMVARYYELCDQRDAVNAKNAPLEAQLDEANAAVAAAQERAGALSARIDDNRGRMAWIEMKREIANIARFLVKIPPRE